MVVIVPIDKRNHELRGGRHMPVISYVRGVKLREAARGRIELLGQGNRDVVVKQIP